MSRIHELDSLPVAQTEHLSARYLHLTETELAYKVTDRTAKDAACIVSFQEGGEAVCSCGSASPCIHMLSALEKARQDGHMEEFTRKTEKQLGSRMIRECSRILPGGEGLHLASTIRLFPDGRLGLGLSVVQDRMSVVKHIGDFLTSHSYGTNYRLSDKLEYSPMTMRFSTQDERLLSILGNHVAPRVETAREWENLQEYEEHLILKDEGGPEYAGRFLILSGALLYSVLHYFESREFVFINGTEKQRQSQIRTLELPFVFRADMENGELTVKAEGFEDLRMVSEDGRFVICNSKLVHLHVAQARICKLLCRNGFRFRYAAGDFPEALAVLLPSLSTIGTLIPSPELSARLIAEPLRPVIYLDLKDQNIVAQVEFHYGDLLINPFATSVEPVSNAEEDGRRKLLLRDGHLENEILGMLSDAGFVVAGGAVILRKSKDILEFCTRGIVKLEGHCTVYVSQRFEKIKPRKLLARAVFGIKGSHLVMQLLEQSGETVDALPVLRAVMQRQEYVRLKSGEFLDIRDMSGLAPVAIELLEANQLDGELQDEDSREMHFHAYRSVYMVNMLKAAGVQTEADQEVEDTVRSLNESGDMGQKELGKELKKQLTTYQLKGVNWLFSLYEARMGGILADEMGLGKTIQMIAVLSAAKQKDGCGKSIIVTPTSLTYHWLAEFRRFAGDLVVRPIGGHRAERQQAIDEALRSPDVDVILTSYPLLRRDIDLLRDAEFRFAILDEAQSVKNAQSYGAAAVKELKAHTRLALTGTPMENHTGELWSIFDFILPGYLGSQASFLRRYGGGEHSDELRSRIQPFLMRRLKSEVLQDLPKKHEEILYAAMTGEQDKLYRKLLKSLQGYVGETLNEGDLPRANLQILSLLLKLRQVCCHPKLFMSDYEGTSGKLELLVQLVENGIANKHRILVFSQFVGMLQLIRKRLTREGIQVLYLDGSTQPDVRQQLCDRFNGGDGKVFLISLKAGGVGLNLTGADLVIHYDPWWNPAAEDQATDRAHRIGQTKDVDVIRLITQDTIEEKVTELGKRKRSLFDKVIVAGETGLSSLTEKEIRELFFDQAEVRST